MPDLKLVPNLLVMYRERVSTIAKDFDSRNLPSDFYAKP